MEQEKSLYRQISEKYEDEYGEHFYTQNYEAYEEELEEKCNSDFDTFVHDCKLEDKLAGCTSEAEEITQIYREWLEEQNIPFEDVFYSLYNSRCYIKGKEWNLKGTSDLDISTNTAIAIAIEDDYLCSGEENYEFFSLPTFI